MVFKKIWVIPLLIFLLSIMLRFYHLDKIYVFGQDEEYQANIAMTLVNDFHPIWIGVSAANTGFYLGPLWTYFTYVWLFLSHGDPLITAYVAALLGAVTTFTIFFIGRKMFSFRVGVVASFLHASLPLVVFFDQKYWNPSITPLLSLIIVYSLYKVRSDKKFWYLFAFAYGLVFHTHLSIAPFILLAIYSARQSLSKSTLVKSLLVFALTTLPLIVFDYFHKFSNVTTPFRLSQIASEYHASLLDKAQALGESIARLFYIHQNPINANEILASCLKYRSTPSVWVVPFILVILLFMFRKRTWVQENTRLLALSILLISISFLLFPGGASEYYLLGLFPLLLFTPGIIWHKYLSPILISIVCLLGISSVLSAYNPYGLFAKKQLISNVMATVNNDPYELIEKGECHQAEGWRYLFKEYAVPPVKASTDYIFSWLYPEELTNTPPKFTVTITGKDSDMPGFSSEIIRNN